jgi:hypothetical protein
MLYIEFLEGTGAVDTKESYVEYKRVEEIYMAADTMTKQDAYRMAKVETVKQYEARRQKARKAELEWVKQNIISAAAYIKGMSEREDYFRRNPKFSTPCGNVFELKLEREINCGSVLMYSLWCNDKQIELNKHCQYGLLPAAEIQTYRADWHDKSPKELKDLFGYIA